MSCGKPGERLPSQRPTSIVRCTCGESFDSHRLDESLIHVPHLSAAMKFVEPNPFTDPDATARKLLEIANATEPAQDGRIYIELVNAAFLKAGGTAEQFRAGIQRAVDKGWMVRHESGTYVKFTDAGAALFA
jgi:hypothetical protein